MMNKIRNELVIAAEAIRTVLVATIALALTFNWIHWSQDQIGAVLAEFGAISGFLTAVTRSGVTPNQNVALTNRDVQTLNDAKQP